MGMTEAYSKKRILLPSSVLLLSLDRCVWCSAALPLPSSPVCSPSPAASCRCFDGVAAIMVLQCKVWRLMFSAVMVHAYTCCCYEYNSHFQFRSLVSPSSPFFFSFQLSQASLKSTLQGSRLSVPRSRKRGSDRTADVMHGHVRHLYLAHALID